MLTVPQPHWVCPRSRHVKPSCPHCSDSRLCHWEPSVVGPGLPAPPRSKPLRFRHSGSPQRHRLGWACVLCPSQVRAAQVMRCLVSAIAATYRLPAARLSRCTTGTPSQGDVDHPEVLQIMSLWGCDCPLLALAACHRRGKVCSRLSLFSPLFSARAWRCLRLGLAFRVIDIPQSGLLTQIILLR